MISESRASQTQVDRSISETEILRREYEQTSEMLKQANINIAYQKNLHKQQVKHLEAIQQQLGEISSTENSLIPMLLDLIDWLDRRVANDLPFHTAQRAKRITELKRAAVSPDTSLSQLYHLVLEAYQIENEYGYNIETYKEQIPLANSTLEAQILRIGRTAMYYLSLDSKHGGYWNMQAKEWQTLDSSLVKQIAHGIGIAKKQLPPSLLILPIDVAEK